MDKHVEIQNVGPIEHLAFDLHGEGGVIVFRGRNGTGKTHAINAVSALTDTQRARHLSSRDGSGRGTIDGLGVELGIGRRTTARGELEVQFIDADDPSTLVDPGFKDEDAADERRLKVLCRLARVKPKIEWFENLVGGADELRKILRPEAKNTDDLVTFAEMARRDFQKAALASESEEQNWGQQSMALRDNNRDIDLTQPDDADELSNALNAITRELAQAEERQRHQLKVQADAKAAREAIDKSVGFEDPQEIANLMFNARNRIDERKARIKAINETIAGLRDQIRTYEGQAAIEDANIRGDLNTIIQLEQRKRAIDSHVEAVANWNETINRAAIPDDEIVSDEALMNMRIEMDIASQRVANGAIVRRAKEQLALAEQYAAKSRAAAKRAEMLRDAAKGVDEVISEAIRKIAPRGFGIIDGRLYVATDRGNELYTQLSAGERWRFALDVTIDACGEGGILAIRQEAWEGLDPINRQAIADHARARRVWILTAQADGGELRAEVFDANATA